MSFTSQPVQSPTYYLACPPGFAQLPAQPIASGLPTQPVIQTAGQPTSSGQATTLPHAFNAVTIHNLTSGVYNMDTGASSHLNSSVTSLSKKINTCMYPSISYEDLYPVTTPSPIPHAILVSQHTWHQRLGHPWGEVLCRLVSSNFNSCNKEKPSVLCHAWKTCEASIC
nr:ribonuclease H-like domain-containing protein [Tanacetum cinerariifolium]